MAGGRDVRDWDRCAPLSAEACHIAQLKSRLYFYGRFRGVHDCTLEIRDWRESARLRFAKIRGVVRSVVAVDCRWLAYPRGKLAREIGNLAYQTLSGAVLFARVSCNLETSWKQAGDKHLLTAEVVCACRSFDSEGGRSTA